MLRIPHTIGFPFRIAVRGVIRLQVALVRAIASLCSVARSERLSALLARPVANGLNAQQFRLFPAQKNGGVSIYPISETHDGVSSRDIEYPSWSSWLVMLDHVPANNAVQEAQSKNLINEFLVTSDRHYRVRALFRNVNATISIENTPDEMIRMPAWNIYAITQFFDAPRQPAGRNCNGHDVFRFSDGVFGTNISTKQFDVVAVHGGQSQHQGVFGRTTIGIQESKPIRFALGVDHIEEKFVYSMNSGSRHGAL